MLKLIGSVMIFGSCAALGLNARRELRRRVAAADAMLLALRLMENEITAHRTPMPEIIDLLAKNENAVIRQIFSGVRRRMRERSGLSLHRGRSARYSGACLKRRGKTMDVDLIFRIAAVGILVAVLGQLLTRSGRDEQALMTTLAGLIVVLMLIVEQISRLFSMMKSVFGF